jgi:predicted amidohydrolase
MWKIAAVQMDSRLGDVSGNRERMCERLATAAQNDARLVIFPECVLSGYSFESLDEAWPHAETVPGPTCERLAQECRRLNVFAVFGLLEKEGTRLFNSCALIGPQGFIAGYRKIHLPCLGIDRFTTLGDRPFAVQDLGGLRVGMNICYDGSFPESSRILTLLGADLIVLPTNWPTGARRVVSHLVQCRALENNVFYAAVNRVGEERGFQFIGQSKIVDINGELLVASETDQEEILYAEIDPARARQKRVINVPGKHEVDRVRNRRPEMYAELIQPHREISATPTQDE